MTLEQCRGRLQARGANNLFVGPSLVGSWCHYHYSEMNLQRPKGGEDDPSFGKAPVLVVSRLYDGFAWVRVTTADLTCLLPQQGVRKLDKVRYAIVEPRGQHSIVRRSIIAVRCTTWCARQPAD